MTERAQAAQQRNSLLLSHANPEDNEVTLWLALQLANEGYRVWCDLTKLLGGEVFWDNIEEVIKTRAVKVLYVLSRTSNAKDGPLKELHFAQGVAKREKLKDFVIPLQIDDLPHGDVTIEITRINTVQFERSWGAGLAKLLEKLEEDAVPKDPKFNRTAVNDWWRTQFSAQQGCGRSPKSTCRTGFPSRISHRMSISIRSRERASAS
jgi:TIR domain-containing protein